MDKEPINIAMCSDHAGYGLKEAIKKHVEAAGYAVTDYGTDSEASCDYPDFAHPCASAVETGNSPIGIATMAIQFAALKPSSVSQPTSGYRFSKVAIILRANFLCGLKILWAKLFFVVDAQCLFGTDFYRFAFVISNHNSFAELCLPLKK